LGALLRDIASYDGTTELARLTDANAELRAEIEKLRGEQ
jgi:cell division protein FtsB